MRLTVPRPIPRKNLYERTSHVPPHHFQASASRLATIPSPQYIATRLGRPARVTSGVVPPGDDIDDTLRGILRTFLHELPSTVGVSHHNLKTVDRVDSSVGTQLVPVSPTAATLAGLPYVDSAGQYSLQLGVGHEDGLNALLKIGPHRVSYALQHDIITHRSVDVLPIIRSCGAKPYWAYLDEQRRVDPVALLGNRGWRNAAEFILERSAGALPQPTILTRQLMAEAAYDPFHDGATLTEQAKARKSVRSLTSHLCHFAMQDDPFALEVASFMGQLFGGALGQVSVQCAGCTSSTTQLPQSPRWQLG